MFDSCHPLHLSSWPLAATKFRKSFASCENGVQSARDEGEKKYTNNRNTRKIKKASLLEAPTAKIANCQPDLFLVNELNDMTFCPSCETCQEESHVEICRGVRA